MLDQIDDLKEVLVKNNLAILDISPVTEVSSTPSVVSITYEQSFTSNDPKITIMNSMQISAYEDKIEKIASTASKSDITHQCKVLDQQLILDSASRIKVKFELKVISKGSIEEALSSAAAFPSLMFDRINDFKDHLVKNDLVITDISPVTEVSSSP